MRHEVFKGLLLTATDDELGDMWRQVRDEKNTREKRRAQEAIDEAWAPFKNIGTNRTKSPARFYVHQFFAPLGGGLQRGSAIDIVYIQPRARRIWYIVPGQDPDNRKHWNSMRAHHILRHDLRRDPPEDVPS